MKVFVGIKKSEVAKEEKTEKTKAREVNIQLFINE